MSIKKIAEMTGASIATVSRVLNDPEYHCRQKGLREKIWNAAMEIDYAPDENARSLRRSGREKNAASHKVMVLMTHTNEESADPFFTELLKIVESQIHRQGCILSGVRYLPQLSEEDTGLDEISRVIKNTEKEKNVNGLVIIGKCRKEALKKLVALRPDIVAINRNSADFAVDEVTCDGKKLAAIAVKHLISMGHTRIAYAGEVSSESRYEGYLETLESNNIIPDERFIFKLPHTQQAGAGLIQKLIRLPYEKPTAIFCANDILAIGMLRTLEKRKNTAYFPSVMGCDDIEEAQFTEPMLSSVHVPKEEMGYLAIQLLCDRMRGGHKSPSKLELLGHLIQRSSVNLPEA